MGQQTLFGDEDDLKAPRTPAPDWLVRELVALGVLPDTAAGYTIRQAFAVRGRLQKAKAADASPARAEQPAPRTPDGATLPERSAVAADLEQVAGDDTADADTLARVVAAGLYTLKRDELVRAAKGLARMLKGE